MKFLVREAMDKQHFNPWLKTVSPTWTWNWAHLQKVREYLSLVTSGDIHKLMIFLHPRSGKSEQVTVRYPVFRIEQDPELSVIIWCYGQALANNFSRKALRIARTRLNLNPKRQAVEEWETVEGGGFKAAAIGTGITGKGAKLIIGDDPIKNRKEANSEVYRDQIWESYRSDLYTRLEPDAAFILQLTRWHDDDLAGRILNSDDGKNFTVLRIPALCESQDERDNFAESVGLPTGQPDLLDRIEGEAMVPERYDEVELAKIREVLGIHNFTALYQQRPTALEGDFFKVENIKITARAPLCVRWVRYWDKAATQDGGKRSAGVLMGITAENDYIVAGCRKGQWSTGKREKIIKQECILDNNLLDKIIYTGVEQEPGSGGKESREATIKMLRGFRTFWDKPTGDKITRAEPYAAQMEGGNVYLVKGAWNKEFIDEHRSAPYGKFMDQVDGASGAFNRLNRRVKRAGGPRKKKRKS